MFPRRLTVTAIAAALAMTAALPVRADTVYPLTVQNCGVNLTFDKAPASAVSVGQGATEVLYSLGLGDKVLGTGVWFTRVLPEFAEINARVERLADNDPSFEAIVSKRPELVASQYEWFIGPQGIIGTRPQFADLGIPTYVMAADCWNKDNASGSDGTRTEMFTMESVYAGISDLAQIFNVAPKGQEVIANLKTREAAAIAKARALDLNGATALFWFSSAEMDVDPYVAGRKGPPAYMMQALGLTNIIESDEEWPVVGWETIARANPTLIVVAQMDRRRFKADDVDNKLAFLKTDPVASQMDAVKNNRIVVMDGHSMDPSIRNIAGLETLAGALAGFDLK